MSGGKWQRLTREDEARTEELGRAADPNSQDQQELVREMKEHLKKLQDLRRTEDPRLSFSTPEFKDAQRTFTDNFKAGWLGGRGSKGAGALGKNFGRPVEWALVQDHPWSTPQLRKLDTPVDVEGKPWKE
ncbi:hypothetical protein V8C86DRAFT_3132189 [Haematococcus lacustris]